MTSKLFSTVLQRLFTLLTQKVLDDDFTEKTTMFLDPEGVKLFSYWLIQQMESIFPTPTAIGGMETRATPLAYSAAVLSPFPLNIFVVHKENSEVEGKIGKDTPVVIIDNVISTGSTTLKTIKAVEALGCKVVGIYCLIDKEENRVPELNLYTPLLTPAFTSAMLLSAKKRIISL